MTSRKKIFFYQFARRVYVNIYKQFLDIFFSFFFTLLTLKNSFICLFVYIVKMILKKYSTHKPSNIVVLV